MYEINELLEQVRDGRPMHWYGLYDTKAGVFVYSSFTDEPKSRWDGDGPVETFDGGFYWEFLWGSGRYIALFVELDGDCMEDVVDAELRRRPKNMRCKTCRWFVPVTRDWGQCVRRAPTEDGFPAVYEISWCGEYEAPESVLEDVLFDELEGVVSQDERFWILAVKKKCGGCIASGRRCPYISIRRCPKLQKVVVEMSGSEGL